MENKRLCITRRNGESVLINDALVKLFAPEGVKIKVVIEAPESVKILRSELLEKMNEVGD